MKKTLFFVIMLFLNVSISTGGALSCESDIEPPKQRQLQIFDRVAGPVTTFAVFYFADLESPRVTFLSSAFLCAAFFGTRYCIKKQSDD